MASDKPRKSAEPGVPGAPFHAPFRDLAKSLKTSPRPSPAPARIVAARPPAAPAGSAASQERRALPGDPQKEAPPVPSDDELLASSRAGAQRLAQPAARVWVRRKPDLSHIEAKKREDLAAMARAEGFDVTYEDLYVRARAASVSRETLSRLEKGEFAISAHLDLHGMPFEDARRAVDEFLALQQKKGHRCVLIVTGKGKNSPNGQGVLRERVPEWLARGPSARRVLAFASARACDGGVGALVVLMRAGTSSKHRIDVEHGGAGPTRT